MARQIEKRDVDGSVYEISQYSATKGMEILVELAKIVGGPLAVIAGGGSSEEITSSEARQKKVVGEAIMALVSRLDSKSTVTLVKAMLEGTLCDGKQILFETHFSGRLGHLLKVLRAVIEVQYGDFLSALGELQGQLGAS